MNNFGHGDEELLDYRYMDMGLSPWENGFLPTGKGHKHMEHFVGMGRQTIEYEMDESLQSAI